MRRFLNTILFLTYTVTSVTGLILLKAHLADARVFFAKAELVALPVLFVCTGATLYVASFAIWLVVLQRNELSVAYPAAIGLTLVFSTLAAGVFLGETLSTRRVVGIAIIFVGIWIVTRS